MANVDNPNGFKYEYALSGIGVPMEKRYLASGVGCIKGDALAVSGGYLILALNTSASIWGIAQETITASDGVQQYVHVIPTAEDRVFSAQADGNFTAALNLSARSIVGGTGVMEVDTDDTDPGVFQVIGLKTGSAWGTNARLLGIFKKSAFTGQA